MTSQNFKSSQIRNQQNSNANCSLSSISHIQTMQNISQLLSNINQTTNTMSKTFQQTILRHQQHFIKTYRIKMGQLVKLYQQLKRTLEDKFINNALMSRLDIIIRQRDYFKYQCLKLNTQYQALTQQQKNLHSQIRNVNQQMAIYKHLLQDQKIRFKQTESVNLELKNSIAQLAKAKNLQKASNLQQSQKYLEETQKSQINYQMKKQICALKKDNKQKNQQIRALKIRVQNSQNAITQTYKQASQKRSLQQIFRNCVQAWKRQIHCKSKNTSRINDNKSTATSNMKRCSSSNTQINQFMNTSNDFKVTNMTIQQFSFAKKKDLLKKLFMSVEFLQFIQQLLFDDQCKVIIEKSTGQKWIQHNRKQLYCYLKQKRLFTRDKSSHPYGKIIA